MGSFFLCKIIFNVMLFYSCVFVYWRAKISQPSGIQKVPKMELSYNTAVVYDSDLICGKNKWVHNVIE